MTALERSSAESGRDEPMVLTRVAVREPGAAEAMLDRFGGLVWSLARRLASSSTEAEDAVQEIFADVWNSAGRFDPALGSEVTFVATIARRRLIDRRRRESRRLDQTPIGEREAGEVVEVERAPTISEEAARAAAALGQLTADQQRVLRLSIYHGLSHERIATATGLPLGTVKTHARRGLIKVRDILQREKGGRG